MSHRRLPVAIVLSLLCWAGGVCGPVTPVHAQALLETVPEAVGLSSSRLQRLGAVLDQYVADGRLAGGVVQISRRGKVAYLRSFGNRDREAGAAMSPDAIFRIASQTKAVVSVATLILQEEGRLLISDPVGKYIPEYLKTTVAVPRAEGGYDVVPAKRPITIRDLLTHTSGVGYGGGVAKDKWEEAKITGWYFANRSEAIAQTVARMASLPFDAQPGEAYVYGYNTDILGVVLEKASGQSLDLLLQQKLFEPLGMTDTHFYLPGDKRERLAVVYGVDGEGLKRIPDDGGMAGQGEYVTGPRLSFSGGAGLLSTAHDYGRFLQMLLDRGVSGGRRVLSRKTVELMTVDHLGSVRFPWSNGTGFGLGFSVVEDLGGRGTAGSVGEFGWGGAYHSTYWVDPQEQLVVVYFTQLLPAGSVDDHGKLRALVYAAIND